MSRKWKQDVIELGSRLDRCSNLLNSNFRHLSDDMAPANHTVEKVVRDKNTIVQITVHTKPNQNIPLKSNDSKSAKHFELKPTSRSPRRTKPGRTKSVAVEKEVLTQERTVPNLIEELKQIIQASGVKDVYEFLKEIDEQDSRRKSEPIKPVSEPSGGTSINPSKETRKDNGRKDNEEIKERRKEWEEERARNMENLTKYKSEIARYKRAYETTLAQTRISQDTNESLNAQVVELKQMISRLTGNNRNLVQLGSDRAAQEGKLLELENKNKLLNSQLDKEIATVKAYEAKFREQEAEIARLRSLTVDIRAQLQHGLEGLELPRPGTTLPQSLVNRTQDILGQTLYNHAPTKPNHPAPTKPNHPAANRKQVRGFRPTDSACNTDSGASRPTSPSSDSAIEDPASESRSLAVPVFNPPPPPKYLPPNFSSGTGVQERSLPEHIFKSNTGTPSTQPPPSTNSSIHFNRQEFGGNPSSKQHGDRRAPPHYYAHSPPTRQVSGSRLHSIIEPQSLHRGGSETNKLAGVGVQERQAAGQGGQEDGKGGRDGDHSSASRNLFTRTRSSVLVNSIQSFSSQPSDPSRLQSNTAGLNPQQSNTADLSAFPAVFTPAQLNLEETASPDEMDEEVSNNKSTPATVIEKAGGEMVRKGSLENKVQAFLDRLHQESLNYSLPQARSFQGPSFHLSVSGEEEGLDNLSRETTLTEGRFRKGLETSIETLPQEDF